MGGLPLAALERYPFTPVDPAHARRPDVKDAPARFTASVPADWLEEQLLRRGSRVRAWERWRYAPPEAFAAFTLEERARIWWGATLDSDLGRWIETHETSLERLRLSQWWYGTSADWNVMVATLAGLRRFRIDGLEARFAWSEQHYSGWAAGVPEDLFLDAPLALLLYRDGEHVLTVGFASSRYGILVSQVQLRQKRGNRWLFKLQGHYLDVVLGAMARAFELPLALTTGESAGQNVRRSYGVDEEDAFSEEEEARIRAFYDRPLSGFRRGAEVRAHTRTYTILERA